METFTMIWVTLSVGVTMLIQWIKGLYRADIPFFPYFLAFAINGLAVYGVSKMLGMTWDWMTFWPVIKDAALISLGIHAGVKTLDKGGVNVPLMQNKNNHSQG